MSTVSRPGLIARMRHWRYEPGCERAWIQTRTGRLPAVLYTVPAGSGDARPG